MRLRVAHGLAGLDAEHDFLSARIGLRQIVAIICGHQRDAGFFGEADDILIEFFFDFEALILNFKEEIIFAENFLQPIRGCARFFVAGIVEQRFIHFPAEAGGESDQSLAVFGEKVVIDARLVIKAFQKSGGNKFD